MQHYFGIPWIEAICYQRLRFFYRAGRPGRLGQFPGPEIRSGIGPVLKSFRGCSEDRNQDCIGCEARDTRECLYARLFVHGSGRSKCMILKPAPSFRAAGTDFQKGELLQFDLILLDTSPETGAQMLAALAACLLRIGRPPVVFEPVEAGFVNADGEFVPAGEYREIPMQRIPVPGCDTDDPGRIELRLHTPTEIRFNNSYYLRDPRRLTFDLLIRRIYDRTMKVAVEHFGADSCLQKIGNSERREMLTAAGDIVLTDAKARWKSVSHRNKPGAVFGGLTGSFVFEGRLEPFMPLLAAAEQLGVGKGTAFGFGHVQIN